MVDMKWSIPMYISQCHVTMLCSINIDNVHCRNDELAYGKNELSIRLRVDT